VPSKDAARLLARFAFNDYALAREWYEKAAAKEEPQAMITLASIYTVPFMN
jgi:TPR repeat protein